MKIISNTCNTMLFCNYVLFILHLFLSTFCLSVLIGLLFLIACDWTKMVGGGMRKLASLYRRTMTAAPGESRRRSSHRREPSPAAPSREEEEEEQVLQEDAEEEQEDAEEAQENDDEEATTGGFASSSSSSVYLRGPMSLPQRPIPRERRPLIRPEGEK